MVKLAFMCPIAKGLVGRVPAAAKGHHGAALQAIDVALHIDNLKISFHFYGTVAVNGQFGFVHIITFDHLTTNRQQGLSLYP